MRGQESPLTNKKGFKLNQYSKLWDDNRMPIPRFIVRSWIKKPILKKLIMWCLWKNYVAFTDFQAALGKKLWFAKRAPIDKYSRICSNIKGQLLYVHTIKLTTQTTSAEWYGYFFMISFKIKNQYFWRAYSLFVANLYVSFGFFYDISLLILKILTNFFFSRWKKNVVGGFLDISIVKCGFFISNFRVEITAFGPL
jgi:hypothetical protein